MYIRRKVFSIIEIEGEERLFSTTDINLEDVEERIFSLNKEKLFARRDYEGLDDAQKEVLKRKRSQLAKDLNRSRNLLSKENIQTMLNNSSDGKLRTDDVIKAGGLASGFSVETGAGKKLAEELAHSFENQSKFHTKIVRKNQLKAAEDLKNDLREKVLNKNNLDVIGERTKKWAKKNKKGLAIGALTTTGLGVGAAAYKHYKDNKKKN